jgi:gliding motility-associated-like protein
MCVKGIKYYALFIAVIFSSVYTMAQGLGQPVLDETFGEGRNPGPPISPFHTGLNYTTDSCAGQGKYTITNSFLRCPHTRIGRSLDRTPNSIMGYFMLVNGLVSSDPKIVYVDTVKDVLCPGTIYQFSVYAINASIPSECTDPILHFPNLTLTIETSSGVVLQSMNTGPMQYDYDPVMPPKFHHLFVNFALPPGISPLVVKLTDEPAGLAPCGYKFAIDDIQFFPVGPETNITFDGAIGQELIESVCSQDNKTISMTGTIGNGYTNTALQWQQSTDNGSTWTDIPGATTLNYSRVFSVVDTFLFRFTGAEAANISNINCRVVSNILKVEVNGIPSDLGVTSNSPVCAGSQLKFNATGGASYEWFGPNGFYDNISFPQIFFSILADSGMYYVDIVSLGGCRAHDSVYVKIIGTEVHVLPVDTSVCNGRTVLLQATAGASYEWTPATGLSNTSIRNPLAKPDVTTDYIVKVTDNSGCSDTAHAHIHIVNATAVKAGAAGADYFCIPSDSASFKDISTGDITKWNWNFDNGQTDTTHEPAIQYYSIPGNKETYTIRLAVADSFGCADTVYHIVKVEDNCYIAVPTAFTPNNDGLNDYLSPLNAYKATNLMFRVYNRNGQVVFETRDWTRKWDGTIGGVKQATDVYVWMLDYTDPKGKRIALKGTSVLIRK